MTIVLIGFMGAGKSTVGLALSKLLACPLLDMDQLVHQKTNTCSMDELFAKGGELLLRETEIQIAKETPLDEPIVISTGGGVVLNKIILDYFKAKGGKVVFLHPPFEQIAKRLEGDRTRPFFKQRSEAQQLYDKRLPLYVAYADLIIPIENQSADEIALMIQQGACHAL